MDSRLQTDFIPGSFNERGLTVPFTTPLLAQARRQGARVVDGLGMLLHQARPGFEAWFGVAPSVTPALRQAVERVQLA